jgi:hypothetical protein
MHKAITPDQIKQKALKCIDTMIKDKESELQAAKSGEMMSLSESIEMEKNIENFLISLKRLKKEITAL